VNATPTGNDVPREHGGLVSYARPQSLLDLFVTFTSLALHGFGGVLPWAHRALVEQKRWLSREDFVELLAFAQLLPGPNVVNLALMVGDRFFGWRGAAVSLAGMLLFPAVLVMAMFLLYAQWSTHPVVRQAMTGMAAVAAGLIIATAFKLALSQRKRLRWLLFGVAAFAMVGVLKLPMLTTLALLIPIAVLLAWRVERGPQP
jgi:chromate transporter